MKKIMELQGNSPAQDFTPLQQDNSQGIDDLMSVDDDQDAVNVRLSQAQKFILSKLSLPDSTPLMAYEQTSNGRNVVANRDTLEKLGMVEVGENAASITEKGKEALKQEGLADDSGALTPQGEQYAYAPDLKAVGELAAQQKNQLQNQAPQKSVTNEPPSEPPMGDIAPQPDTGTPALESWTMITNMQTELSEKNFIRKHGKRL